MKVPGILMDWQNRRDKLCGKVHFFVEVISPHPSAIGGKLQMELPTESQEAATATRYRQ